MRRRSFVGRLAAVAATLPVLGSLVPQEARARGAQKPTLRVMMKSAWGSDDPTKAAFPFLHGLALAEAGHEVQIFLLGEAVSLMRSSVAAAVVPIGWPPLGEALSKGQRPGGSRSSPAARARGRAGSRRGTSRRGAPSSATRRSSWSSSSGPTASSPSSGDLTRRCR